MAQPEKKVKDAIKRTLSKLWPDVFQIMVVPGGFGKNGLPDHIACAPVTITQDMVGETHGMFIGIEAKTETGKLKGIQAVRIAEIFKAGGFASVIFGEAKIPDLEAILKKHFKL